MKNSVLITDYSSVNSFKFCLWLWVYLCDQ